MNDKLPPLISIAMTTFNGEKYLVDQIDSILNQSYRNIELIICDDASTDKTVKIIEDYQKKDKRIKLFKNDERLGVVKNFEKAIGLCKGEFIALSDQDDVWLESKLKELLENIGDNLLVHSDAYLIDSKGKVFVESYTEFSKKLMSPKNLIDAILNRYVTGSTSMFSKKLLEFALPFTENIFIHDKWIGCVAFVHGKVTYVDKPLLKYRQHENSSIGAEVIEKINFTHKIMKFLKNSQYYRNHPLFKRQMKQQLHFITLLSNKLEARIEPRTKKKLDLLKAYFQNASENGIKFRAFLIRLLMFRHFEKNSTFKTRLFHCLKILFM